MKTYYVLRTDPADGGGIQWSCAIEASRPARALIECLRIYDEVASEIEIVKDDEGNFYELYTNDNGMTWKKATKRRANKLVVIGRE